MIRRCAQFVTRQARRVPCDRQCLTFYCGQHGGRMRTRRLPRTERNFGDLNQRLKETHAIWPYQNPN